MDSEQQHKDQSPSAPNPPAAVLNEVLNTVADIGLAATEDIPAGEILDTVADAASAATESIGEAIGSVFDSL